MVSAPSRAAVIAARTEYNRSLTENRGSSIKEAVEAAHDPALGLDRSVCLRDVVEALRGWDPRLSGPTGGRSADFIEREFGGG